MPAPTRFTNDEMDDGILAILEKPRHVWSVSFYWLMLYLVDKTRAPSFPANRYEKNQLKRRLQWLARHGFVSYNGLVWRITDHPSARG